MHKSEGFKCCPLRGKTRLSEIGVSTWTERNTKGVSTLRSVVDEARSERMRIIFLHAIHKCHPHLGSLWLFLLGYSN